MNTRNTDKIIRQIIDGMFRYYNYNIEDFSYISEMESNWGLSRLLEDGTKEVIIFISLDNANLNELFINEFCTKIQCSRDKLIQVLLIDETTQKDLAQNNLTYLNSNNCAENSFILLDLINRDLQIANSGLESLARQIWGIIDSFTKVSSNRKRAYVSYGLISINIIIFFISAVLSGNFFEINTDVLIALGAKVNIAIENGQWYRLFTSMFLHGGLLHIAANMYSLYAIGPLVERIYGKIKFIFIYLASGIIASLFSFLFSDSVSIGASGAIFGVLGVLLIFALQERKSLGKDFFISIASTIAINLYIGLTLPGIDNYAHLGGLISGSALAVAVKRKDK